MPSSLRFAVICSSNQNRSMETHLFLSKRGFKVRSFGTGDKVKLPGNAPDKPNVYDFGTPYEAMYQDLKKKDLTLYTNNGILSMLDRNKRIKLAPERFQQNFDIFDVLFTVEERVYDQVLEEFAKRPIRYTSPVHIVNIDVLDNHEEATLGAFMFCELAQLMADSEDLDNDIDELLQEFESTKNRPILHTVQFY